jgi:foldase protein PrsA
MAAKRKTKKTKASPKKAKRSRTRKKVSAKTSEVMLSSEKAGTNGKAKMGKSKLLKSNKLYYIIAVVMIVAGALYLARGLFVVAIVNGHPITRLAIVKQLEKQGGSQVLDSLVTEDLVNQEIAKRGISVSDSEIQDEIDSISATVEGQGTTLDAALAAQGQTMDDLRKNIELRLSAEKILQDSISVTDDEAKEYFDQNKDYYAEDAKYEDMSDDIKEQLRQQKLQTEFQKLIDQLKSDASIVYFVNY